ncbi:MAG: HAD family phosphatase, partial [Puniceicoccaceae bacterium]
MIRALIFDFDGLIRDTESAEFEAWRAVYEAHGAELPLERWVLCIGTRGGFDPFAYLEEQVGRSMDRGVARAEQRAQMRRLMEGRGAMAGVEEWVKAARDRGLGLAVASSSDRGEVVRQ